MSLFHAVVWMDHSQAHVIHFNWDHEARDVVRSGDRPTHQHRKQGAVGSGKAPPDREFFDAVIASIGQAQEILLSGPSGAKTEFASYVQKTAPGLRARIVQVEPLDHPTDNQLLAHARSYFDQADRMRGVPSNPA